MMAMRVVSATVEEGIAARLERLATETSRKKSYFVNQALKEYFLALDDYETALSRKGGATTTIAKVKKELGL
jgi:predicted transcriptional regulator